MYSGSLVPFESVCVCVGGGGGAENCLALIFIVVFGGVLAGDKAMSPENICKNME